MNRIYKSVWNAVTRSWTAVSEAQKSKGKRTSLKSIFLMSLMSMSVLTNTVYAYDNDADIVGDLKFSIGVNSPSKVDYEKSHFEGL